MINPLLAAQQARAGNQQVAPQIQAFGPQTSQTLLQQQQLNTPSIGSRIDGPSPIMVRQDPNFYAQQERDRVFTAMNQERQRMSASDLQQRGAQAASALQAQRDQATGGRLDKTITSNIEAAKIHNKNAKDAAELANKLKVKLQKLIDKRAQGRLDAGIGAQIADTAQKLENARAVAGEEHDNAVEIVELEETKRNNEASLLQKQRTDEATLFASNADARITRADELALSRIEVDNTNKREQDKDADDRRRKTEEWVIAQQTIARAEQQARTDSRFAPLVGPAKQALKDYHTFEPEAHKRAVYDNLLTDAAVANVTEEQVNELYHQSLQASGQPVSHIRSRLPGGKRNPVYERFARMALQSNPEYEKLAGAAGKQANVETQALSQQLQQASLAHLATLNKLGYSLNPITPATATQATPTPTPSPTPPGFPATIPGAPAGTPLTPTPATTPPAGLPAPAATPPGLPSTTPPGASNPITPAHSNRFTAAALKGRNHISTDGLPFPIVKPRPGITRSKDESGIIDRRSGTEELYLPQGGLFFDQSAEDGGLGAGWAPGIMADVPGAVADYPRVVAGFLALGIGSELHIKTEMGKKWAEKQFQAEYDKLKGKDYTKTIKTGARAGQPMTLAGAAKDQAVLRATMEELAKELKVELPKKANGDPKFSQVGSAEFQESIAKIKKGFVSRFAPKLGLGMFAKGTKAKWIAGAKFLGVAGGIYGLSEAINSQSSEDAVKYKKMLTLMNELDTQQDDIEDSRDQLRTQALDIQDANDTNATANPLTP